MSSGGIIGSGVVLLAFSVSPGYGQAVRAIGPYAGMVVSSPRVALPDVNAGEIVREIGDPHTGDRWLLLRDSRHPGGPGLLLLVAAVRTGPRQGAQGAQTPVPLIHAGDRVTVEEHTAVVDAHLEAVAMGPALLGSEFNVRLTMGGTVARAIALAPGRAAFLVQREEQR